MGYHVWYVEKRSARLESGEIMLEKVTRRGYAQVSKDGIRATRGTLRKRKRRKSLIKKTLTFVVLMFLAIVAYGGYVFFEAYSASKASYQALERGEKSDLRHSAVAVTKDPISILILGIEDYSSENDRGRTDTIMLATLNPHSKSVKLLTIPRDTRVEIVGRDRMDKINHAHAFGGTDMTIDTVENFLDIPIDYFIKVNFDGFIDIVDEIGGITVDVPFDFTAHTTVPGGRAHFTEGEMHLDGEEALAYARMRKDDPRGDFGRGERQKQVLKAAIDQALTVSTLFKVDKITEHLGENIETNLKPTEILALQQKYGSINTSLIDSLSLEGHDEYIRSIYYFIPDKESLESTKIELQVHLDIADDIQSNTERESEMGYESGFERNASY